MIYVIDDVLPKDEIKALAKVASEGEYREGAAGAGWQAREVKNNLELNSKETQVIAKRVGEALGRNKKFMALAWPKSIVAMIVSRYRPGMTYGTHVDNAIMRNARTDMSFTLFLSDPKTYEGGELVIEEGDHERVIKLQQGQMVLYATSQLHHVAEVTKGERLAVVGWVRSFVRDPAAREALYDLETVTQALRDRPEDREILDRVAKVRTNLFRRWAED